MNESAALKAASISLRVIETVRASARRPLTSYTAVVQGPDEDPATYLVQ